MMDGRKVKGAPRNEHPPSCGDAGYPEFRAGLEVVPADISRRM